MRRGRESDHRVRGLSLKGRFVLAMTIALCFVMLIAGYLIYAGSTRIAENVQNDRISDAVRFTQEGRPIEVSQPGLDHPSGVKIHAFRWGRDKDRTGTLYRFEEDEEGVANEDVELRVPEGRTVGQYLLRTIGAIMVLVVLVGALVAFWVASQVSRPVHRLIEDVRQISKGNLAHRTNSVGTGEIELLSRSIDRMTRDLAEAQEAQVELSMRERELEVAGGVREALLPLTTPLVEGYDLGAAFLSSVDFGGDFHDFIELPDKNGGEGRVGLLVCGVSGTGVPAALIGSTARSYLRSELERNADVGEALRRVNRWLVSDVRRGMFVTALYALIDPEKGTALVACAGHRIPLLRFAAEDESLRVVHPEGIALGFDKGPVFDRRLEVVEVPIDPGDRLVLMNSAPVELRNADDKELGERALYARVKRHATLETPKFLKSLRRDLETFVGSDDLTADVSIVTISRERQS